MKKKLLKWYYKYGRSLPWRNIDDPYLTWVSEIMLQQTQVDTVIPYFEKWKKIYPNVHSLAKAGIDEVLKLWEGLGYYSRCRNLHKTARIISDQYNGKLPEEFKTLLTLPGIGIYTAGAILSIGYNKFYPAVDGNVIRVFSRLLGLTETDKKILESKISEFIIQNLRSGAPGDLNQAIMDLGSMVCTPMKPDCASCPLKSDCIAYEKNIQDKLPVKGPKKTIPVFDVVVGIIWHKNKFFIQKRGPSGHLGGLWEFPGGKIEKQESPEEALIREIREETGFDIIVGRKLGVIKHAYSHFKITMTAFECRLTKIPPRVKDSDNATWIKITEINKYAFPKANHKLFDVLISKDEIND